MELVRKLCLSLIGHVWLILNQLNKVSIGPDIYLADGIGAVLHLISLYLCSLLLECSCFIMLLCFFSRENFFVITTTTTTTNAAATTTTSNNNH